MMHANNGPSSYNTKVTGNWRFRCNHLYSGSPPSSCTC